MVLWSVLIRAVLDWASGRLERPRLLLEMLPMYVGLFDFSPTSPSVCVKARPWRHFTPVSDVRPIA